MHLFAPTWKGFKVNEPFCCGKEGVILAHADIPAGMDLGAALTDQDVAADDVFTTKFLNAQSF